MFSSHSFFTTGKHNSIGVYLVIFILTVFFTNLRQNVVTNNQCEICSDKAGYYMYLPATFHWGFGTSHYEESFEEQHGYGFKIDRENDIVITKFTSGVAILLSPFYGLGTIIDRVFSLGNHPYSRFYLFFINLGSAFYLTLGLYFLRKWLHNYVDAISSFWTIITLILATNLTYYTLDENLMSHLYSFTLFVLILYSIKRFYQSSHLKYFILFSFALALSILVRPTNILFLPIALFLDIKDFESLKKNLLQLISFKTIILGSLILLLVLSPQMVYWKMAYDKYIVWSYSGEGFTLWNRPDFLITWFSPQSGLIPYVPVFILSIIFWIVMYRRKAANVWLILITFLAISYMCAAWHNPFFGDCNFGKRPMVEYYPVLFLPIAFMFSYYPSFSIQIQKILIGSLMIFSYYHLTLFGVFDTCFYGEVWEWDTFGALVKKAIVLIR
ncbi:hypothetical protein KFE94_00545 [bacterium SCSIO 12643]|nr:hypothetical protein KFE94_00545 [bacterium SCSIO 12643]